MTSHESIGPMLFSTAEREHRFEATAAIAARASEAQHDQILVAVSNPETVEGLIRLAAQLSRPEEIVVALKVVTVIHDASLSVAQRQAALSRRFRDILQSAIKHGEEAGAQVETELRAAHTVGGGILEVAADRPDIRLLLLGWRGQLSPGHLRTNVCREVLRTSRRDVGVFLNKEFEQARRILVPLGGGPHARLGLRLAADLAASTAAEIKVLRVVAAPGDHRAAEAHLRELVRNELRDDLQHAVQPRVVQSASVVSGILEEAERDCDLIVMGASEEGALRTWLFGSIPDVIAEQATCSVLLVHKHEIAAVSWLRRLLTRIWGWRGLRPRAEALE